MWEQIEKLEVKDNDILVVKNWDQEMLRSLGEVVRQSGRRGIIVVAISEGQSIETLTDEQYDILKQMISMRELKNGASH